MSHTQKLLLPGILVCSVMLRMAVAFYLGDIVDAPPLMTDQRSYHALGARLISGYGFSFDKPWYPFTLANTPTAHWSFLYSLIVACVYATFGVHPLFMRLVQAILGGLLLPLAVYRLAYQVFGSVVPDESAAHTRGGQVPDVVPLVAAAISAVYGYFVLYAATIMTETLFIVAVLWSLDVGLRIINYTQLERRVPNGLVLQLGFSLSIGTLLRQSILPWVPALVACLLWVGWRNGQLRDMARVGLLVCAMFAASILPWTYRNYRAYGQFLLLNSNTGYAMYSAQHPVHGTHFREFDAAPLPQDVVWGNEAMMDRELLRRGLEFVIEDPGRYLVLSLSRARAFFEFWPTTDTTWLHNIGRVGSFGLFLPFMLYGLCHMLRRPSLMQSSGLVLVFATYHTLLHLLTWAMVRYRLPVDAVMMPFAGWAVVDLSRRASRVLRNMHIIRRKSADLEPNAFPSVPPSVGGS